MSTHQSTETLISDLDAELKRTAQAVTKMQETLIVISHRYAELQHQLAQERAVVQYEQTPPPMTELGTALSGVQTKLARSPESAGHDERQDAAGITNAEDDAHPVNHEPGGTAVSGEDLDHAFEQVGSADSTAEPEAQAVPTRTAAAAPAGGARPAPRASTFGAPRRAAAQAPAPQSASAPARTPAPAPAPAPMSQRPSPTASRSDPLSGQGDQAARPRMRALGSAGR